MGRSSCQSVRQNVGRFSCVRHFVTHNCYLRRALPAFGIGEGENLSRVCLPYWLRAHAPTVIAQDRMRGVDGGLWWLGSAKRLERKAR